MPLSPMPGLRVVAAIVAALVLVQVLYEELLVYLATTGSGLPAWAASPLVVVGIPGAIALLLAGVLIGGPILYADRFW